MKLLQMFLTEALSEPLPNIPQLQFKQFDPNQIVRLIANTILSLAIVIGLIYGGWVTAHGVTEKEPSDIRQGLMIAIGSFVIVGLFMIVLNLVIL